MLDGEAALKRIVRTRIGQIVANRLTKLGQIIPLNYFGITSLFNEHLQKSVFIQFQSIVDNNETKEKRF